MRESLQDFGLRLVLGMVYLLTENLRAHAESVKTSSNSAWGTRPSTMVTLLTPP